MNISKENLETVVLCNLGEWNRHCKNVAHSSMIKDYINCDGYKTLVYLGQTNQKKVLELIKDNWDNVPIHGFSLLVKEIVGDKFNIPKDLRGKIRKMRTYTLMWLTAYCTLQ